MVEKKVIKVDFDIDEKMALMLGTTVTTKYCYAWEDAHGFEYNPENKRLLDAVLTVVVLAPNNEWELFFLDNYVKA